MVTAPAQADLLAELTAQQRQIVRMAARGLRNREIAERLMLSPRSVGSHQRVSETGCQQPQPAPRSVRRSVSPWSTSPELGGCRMALAGDCADATIPAAFGWSTSPAKLSDSTQPHLCRRRGMRFLPSIPAVSAGSTGIPSPSTRCPASGPSCAATAAGGSARVMVNTVHTVLKMISPAGLRERPAVRFW
ncbi:response regulator transcription factor [Streptomyces sp. NPDC056638]|uniref:response regulator transcription factor n=1 Tax=Streptomyces sp. NPDC056638 TaxID=3345887 RepID=UPI0036B38763